MDPKLLWETNCGETFTGTYFTFTWTPLTSFSCPIAWSERYGGAEWKTC